MLPGTSWGKLSRIFFHLTNQHNSHLYCTETTKNLATRCVLRAQHASKCVCCRGYTPGPAGELTALPQNFLLHLGRERSGEEEGRQRKGKGGKVDVGKERLGVRLVPGADGDERPGPGGVSVTDL